MFHNSCSKSVRCLLLMTLHVMNTQLFFGQSNIGNVPERTARTGSLNDLRKASNQNLDEFVFKQFSNPNSFYWPGYFWSWNDTLTEDIISKQLADMASHGALSVTPLPLPKGFRPVIMPTLMTPDYMTSDYLGLFRFAAEKCQSLKMKLWLYDEGGWPSGSCLGRVVAQNPSLSAQSLSRQIFTPGKGSAFTVPFDCLSAFLYQGETKIRQLVPGTTDIINFDKARILVFSVKKGGAYPNLLNPESTQEFLRLTHEEYKKTIGAYFGNTIQITFTDEPQAANPGWTDDLTADFISRNGYDIRNELPSIFEGDNENDRKVRIDYFNWWSQRFAEAYFGQIQKWCHQNNLFSGGHLNGEDATVYARIYGFGHALRALRRMDVPGVDVIWRQLWPGGNNHHFPKYASTVSHQAGLPWAFSESFCVYGNGLTPGQMKWISDYQYVRGINLLVMGDYPLSNKDWLMAGERPSFGVGNPLWQYMDVYHGYIGRLGYLLSLGKPDIKIAIYYPIRDIWAGGSELNSVCSSNDELARTLLENQCDFDFIDDDMLESDSTKIVNRQLVVGPMGYDAVCVSRSRYMSDKSIVKLDHFINAGGKVFWVDNPIGTNKPRGATLTSLSRLPSLLSPTVALGSPNVNIRVCKRALVNSSIYFVTNEDTCETSSTLQFNESLQIVQLDPETGKCWIPSHAIRTSKGWEMPINLKFAGSCLFIFTNALPPLEPMPSFPARVLQNISTGWTCRKATEFILGEHDVEVHDLPLAQPVDIVLGDWRYVIGGNYSGDIEYMVRFECTDSVKQNAQVLDLGNVRYVCQASLNGEPLGKKLWQPFVYDIKGMIRKGINELRVTVTNTFANQYIFTNSLDKWTPNQLGPYHQKALGFEKESLSSGLFGPVTIR
jgi:hypothetical protein